MDSGDVQNVILRCTLCNKPFDKQSSLRRHGYYCRSLKGVNSIRPRSCTACATRKARCDNQQPTCSRCTANGIICLYPVGKPRASKSRTPSDGNVQPEVVNDTSIGSPSPHIGDEVNSSASSDPSHGISESFLEEFNAAQVDWENLELDLARMNEESTKEHNPHLKSDDHVQSSSQHKTQEATRIDHATLEISRSPDFTVRSLIPRPETYTRQRKIADLLVQALKSYPIMMAQPKTFPPFIHPHLVWSNTEHKDMESLHNCVSLLHMIRSEGRFSRKLFWQNVKMECERFGEQYPNMNRWELLSAMQSLCIYILIRINEGFTEHNNFDFLLLSTVAVIARQMSKKCALYEIHFNPPPAELENRWKDWIYEESVRRICVMYQVLNLITYFEPAALCCLPLNLLLAPLPTTKLLWDAADSSKWKAQREREVDDQNEFGLDKNGDLVQLNTTQRPPAAEWLSHGFRDTTTSPADWAEWCSERDSFGGLLMLAAAMAAPT